MQLEKMEHKNGRKNGKLIGDVYNMKVNTHYMVQWYAGKRTSNML